MVYGLNIVPAGKFLYGAEPLDGNIAGIRAVDRTPDGGVSFESVYAGRRCALDGFPTRMKWKGPKGSSIGDFNSQHLVNISNRAKTFIEEREPGIHQFVPVDFVDKAGLLIEKRHFFVVCRRLDSIDRGKTTFVLLRGKIWRTAQEVRDRFPDDLPAGFDMRVEPELVFSRAQIGQSQLWRDKHLDNGAIWLSQEFGDALKASDLSGVKLSASGIAEV